MIIIGKYVPPPAPETELVHNLKLVVRRLLDRPHRWAWDLRDNRDGSWYESMLEFDSEAQARRSGLSRLAELSNLARGGRPDENEIDEAA
jgi:hypothetical protein